MDWEQIWRQHWQEIYRFIAYRVSDRQEAEDLTQETFLRAIRTEARYIENNDNIVGLLKTIARNLIIDKWRSSKKTNNQVPLEMEFAISSPEKGPEEEVVQMDEVRRALSLLNEEQQQVITYRLLRGFSVKDTAELLGKSESSIKTTQFRAIEMIRKILTRTGGMDYGYSRR
ncbi:RNA polymerase sigma factor [Paenibacillus sediminis]|uniref:RNA polymerase sigma-70 factor (ECF subfamily) n=1 Tax=Paenibacillus sediminis TaxID=664909 RepID=A0ABS4H3U5_9BACL|nr:RNA polymerase sigma factor [Paenibacillus sediminis]MBP1937204.1 RNA polymerase sigma-70 factor (ECF subfamily) [Paenibacillus sediminis]